MNKPTLAAVLILAAGLTLSACAGTAQTGAASMPVPTNTAQASISSPTLAPTESPTPPTPTAATPLLYLSPDLPKDFLDQVHLPAGLGATTSPEQAGLRIDLQSKTPWSTWIYALTAPFPTLQDEITFAQLAAVWRDEPTAPDLPAHLLVDSSTFAVFSTRWGSPSERVRSLPAGQILAQSWANPQDWAILPFEQLEPRWKVIAVDGQNPLHKDFDLAAYPLRLGIGLEGDPAQIAALENEHGPSTTAPLFPAGNRRADRLTTVVVTGVTALVRGTAAYMEQFGMDYPAQDILPWLRDADILHINNEIAFAENCPSPNNWSQGLAFCSQARYIQLLDDIGTDVIDLAGDHFADWGQEAMYFTLNLYRERGWKVYGGGENSQQAKQPALFDHNGNQIAFIGCNYKAPGYATATLTTPGAVHCDPAWLEPEIRQVRSDGYLPIVTFQHEEYYEYIARPQLQTDFRAAAQAGAVIVSGSQAHQPQALEFDGTSLLHYGLGNLFFDQVFSMDATRDAFIDRHIFYDGRYIGTELLTIRFVDYARSRPMTPAERQALLKIVFDASRWDVNSQVK